ncbi:MAG: 4a-hydroxytetrahydrobiopterin dehydratase [Planctomycetes bacterium]|nr:4a-hydroxytetrahydrobiopterin dehydratase [Planctomycetota bacterium]
MDKFEEIPLVSKECKSCRNAACPLESKESNNLMGQLSADWVITDGRLERQFTFKNFRQALDMTNRIGQLAEQEGHHPDIFLAWGSVKVTLFTHKVGGLTEEDFILAAKIDRL